MSRTFLSLAGGLLAMLCIVSSSPAWPGPVADDPLLRMPGTQPGQVTLEGPNRCTNCHEGYNPAIEPGFNWKGSMMAQSSRDPLFWATFVVAAQDSIHVLGNPNATDLCLRCHFPKGWLEGRSETLNASAMGGDDYDGVQCDFCHRMWDPHFADTYNGDREGSDWPGYWDEAGTLSGPAAAETYTADLGQAATISRMDGQPFYAGERPAATAYTEAGSGQYFVSSGDDKRASFADAAARHRMLYSRFHKSKYMCGTCHDVSNAVLANLRLEPGPDGSLPSEGLASFAYFHVERTFSEFMLSDYGLQGGREGIGPFAPANFETSQPGNLIAACQDCHMRDGIGQGAGMKNAVVRPGGDEHPESGQPIHDLTGGNVWVPSILASTVSGSPNYDAYNAGLLLQGPAALTLDLGQGLGLDPAALLAGADRARQQLELAATIEALDYDAGTGTLSFRVQNQTGHKLISGFPEGRRMFLNVRAYQGQDLIYEVNPYDAAAATLKSLDYAYQPGQGVPMPAPIGVAEAYVDALVYETKPTSDITNETKTFHFVLGTDRYKDNRIPPKGFRIAEADARLSVPVWEGTPDPGFFTAAEYAGGYDAVSIGIAPGADRVEVNLYYQTTSREYVEFLRDEITGSGNRTLPDGAYVAQSDPFFAQLHAWGDTIWALWRHNRDLPGAAPVLMATASTGGSVVCDAAVPTGFSATAAHQEVALSWAADAGAAGYRVYRDQSGKAQLLADVGAANGYLDAGLTNGQQYCYVVTSYTASCESGYSEVACATPQSNVQLTAGANTLEAGALTESGKGKDKAVTFAIGDSFTAGDTIAFRALLVDATDQPLPGASFTLQIEGGESVALTSAGAGDDGYAVATWTTSAPNKRGAGGTAPGEYTATISGVSAGGHTWDGALLGVVFTLQ